MLSLLYTPKIPVVSVTNKSLFDYCSKCTKNSIKNICKKTSLERNENKLKITNSFETDSGNDDNPEIKDYRLLAYICVTTIVFLFYKRHH